MVCPVRPVCSSPFVTLAVASSMSLWLLWRPPMVTTLFLLYFNYVYFHCYATVLYWEYSLLLLPLRIRFFYIYINVTNDMGPFSNYVLFQAIYQCLGVFQVVSTEFCHVCNLRLPFHLCVCLWICLSLMVMISSERWCHFQTLPKYVSLFWKRVFFLSLF